MKSSRRLLYCLYEVQMKLYSLSINCLSPAPDLALSYKEEVIICLPASFSSLLVKIWKKLANITERLKTKFEKSKNRKTFRGANKDKKWKSVWLLLEPGKYSMYCIRNFYWKSVENGATNPIVIVDLNYNNFNNKTARISNGEKFWIRNGLYNLKTENADILHSQSAWLNDRTMGAAQKLICKTFGDERSYQSVLKMQRKVSLPFQTVNHDHIQLWHDGSSHWFLDFCSSSRIQICDSLSCS